MKINNSIRKKRVGIEKMEAFDELSFEACADAADGTDTGSIRTNVERYNRIERKRIIQIY